MKSNTQNTKIEAVTEKTLVVGIDVGSEFHYARAFDWRGIEFSKKPFKFSNTEPGFIEFKAWILHIQTEHDKDAVVPGMEPTGHYWFIPCARGAAVWRPVVMQLRWKRMRGSLAEAFLSEQ